jgi:tetratricopeptide (TPR) repeat protein
MTRSKLALLCGAVLLAVVASGCNKLKARDQLHKGVNAFQNAQYQPATEFFKEAVRLDPTFLTAKLYLATAYFQQYVPGGESPENLQVAQNAINAFEDVLNSDPANKTALASIATLYYNMKDFDKAKEFQRKRIQVDPSNPEPYYSIGVIDWAISYKNDGELRKSLNLNIPKPDGSLPDLPVKESAQLADQNNTLVDEGIQNLQKALDLKPNDFATMAYLNLMFRQKADIEADKGARAEDLKTADDWEQKALNARKAAAAEPTASSSNSSQ